jgi:uncharacterized RDD family membrane protein YckC
VAIIIDSLLLGVVGGILGLILFGAGRLVFGFAIGLAYYGYCNGVVGQTVGKMALRIRVVDRTTGQPIGLGRGVVRYFIYVILFAACLIPGIINGLSPLWDNLRQAWHDKAVNSLVVDAD